MPIYLQEEEVLSDVVGYGGSQSSVADAGFAKAQNDAKKQYAEQFESFSSDVSQVILPSLRTENEVGAVLASESFAHITDMVDRDYLPSNDLGEFEDRTEYYDELLGAKNADHMRAIKNDIVAREKDRLAIQEAGVGANLLAGLAAGILSPTNLIPAGAIVKGAKGVKTAASAGKGAAIGVSAMALSESVLHDADPTRTNDESYMALGAGAVLGGLLGGAGAMLSKQEFDDLALRLVKDVEEGVDVQPSPALKQFEELRSVGAAEVPKLTMDDLTIVGKGAQSVAKASRMLNPFNRLITSSFLSSRESLVNMAETALKLNVHTRGGTTGTAAETMIKEFDKYRAHGLNAMREGYKDYQVSRKQNPAAPSLTSKEYRERLSRALRNGDLDNEIPAITESAKRVRAEVLEPMKREAIESGLLPADVSPKFADSYFHRMWDKSKLISNAPEAMKMLKGWAVDEVEKAKVSLQARIAGADRMYEKRISDNIKTIERQNVKLADELPQHKVSLSNITEQEDSLRDFMGRQISEEDVNNYLNRNNLEDVASAVTVLNSRPLKAPQNLYEFSRKVGGLTDEEGELAQVGLSYGRGFSRKGKMSLDSFGERAWQEGFFESRPEASELLDALSGSQKGFAPVVRDADAGEYAKYVADSELREAADIYLDELSKQGIDIDIKSFWKSVKDDIRDIKGELREMKKVAAKEVKDIREGARRVRSELSDLVKESKRLKNAEKAAARRIAKAKSKENSQLIAKRENLRIRYENELDLISDSFAADDMADEVYRTLTSYSGAHVPSWITPLTRGSMKQKTLNIPDNIAEPFLENDAAAVLDSYVRKASADISLTRKFGRADMRDQLAQLDDEFNEKLLGATTEKERRKLEKEYRSNRDDIEAMRDILRGNFNKSDPDSIIREGGIALKDMSYMTSMGGVMASSFADISRHVMHHGMTRAFKGLMNVTRINSELGKMKLEDLREAGFLFERVLANRLQTIGDISDPHARGTMLTKLTGQLSNQFSKLTMINHWNDIQKGFSASLTQNKILRNIDGDSENVFMREMGIDQYQQKTISEQFKKHGVIDGGDGYIANLKNWDDTPRARAAKRAYVGALRKSADIDIISKGVADTPIFSNTPLGGVIMQFTSFMISSHQRLLMRGMQQNDAAFYSGALGMVAMGAMVAAFKQTELEKSYELRGESYKGKKLKDWGFGDFVFHGIDRSGLVAVGLDFNNRFEKLGGYGLTRATGIAESKRYFHRDNLGVFLGPVADDIDKLLHLSVLPFSGEEMKKRDLRNIRGFIPGQNLDFAGIRFGFDVIEGKTAKELELK